MIAENPSWIRHCGTHILSNAIQPGGLRIKNKYCIIKYHTSLWTIVMDDIDVEAKVDVAKLRQKLQTMDTLQKELEILQRQKATSEQAAICPKLRQSSGGVWGWLAVAPPE